MVNYLHVKDWDKFQHYKDRNPVWIKLYTDTFTNYDFMCLQDASKLLAICIWTLAARSSEGKIPADFAYIKNQCGLGDSVTIENLKELVEQGYIIDASNSLAICYQHAIPEKERETYSKETEKKDIPPPPKNSYTPEFEQFWQEYPPNKQSKAESFKAYQKATKETDHETIIAGARAYRADIERTGTGKDHTAHATTWLNNKRWGVDYSPGKLPTRQPVDRQSKFMAGVAALFEDEGGGERISGGCGGAASAGSPTGH